MRMCRCSSSKCGMRFTLKICWPLLFLVCLQKNLRPKFKRSMADKAPWQKKSGTDVRTSLAYLLMLLASRLGSAWESNHTPHVRVRGQLPACAVLKGLNRPHQITTLRQNASSTLCFGLGLVFLIGKGQRTTEQQFVHPAVDSRFVINTCRLRMWICWKISEPCLCHTLHFSRTTFLHYE